MDEERGNKKLEFLRNQAKFIRSNGFDSVRIFASFHSNEEGHSFTADVGDGNWYAIYGQIREWCIMMDELARNKVRHDAGTP